MPEDRETDQAETTVDPTTGESASVRRIQPFRATKEYICPGCNQEIARAVGHYVVVPEGAVDLRRHWHIACWERRAGTPRRR